MVDFAQSYLGKLRAVVGSRLLMIPGTRLFLEDEQGRFLMQHRRDFRVWGFPGGNAEEGEPLDHCIVREVLEETGLDVDPADLVPVAFSSDPRHETLTYPNGDRCQFYVLMYWATRFRGRLSVLDDESLALEWFAPEDFPEMLPTMRRGFDAFVRFRTSGLFQVM